MITRRTIPNSWLRHGRTTEELPFDSPWLVDYIPDDYCEGWRIVLDGVGCVLPEAWAETRLRDGMAFSVAPKIEDPVTIGLILALGGTAFLAVGAAAAGYSVYQSRKAAGLGDKESLNNSPTYGWDGVQNTVSADLPIAILYGRHRIGGNIINTYVSSEEEKSFLHMQIALGEGPIQSIGGVTADTTDPLLSDIPLVHTADSNGFEGGEWDWGSSWQRPFQYWGIDQNFYPDGSSFEWANKEFAPKLMRSITKATDFLVVDLRADDPANLISTGWLGITGFDRLPPEGNVYNVIRPENRRSWILYDLTGLGITDEWQTFTLPLSGFTAAPAGATALSHVTSIIWYNSWYEEAPSTQVYMRDAYLRHTNTLAGVGDLIKVNDTDLDALDFAEIEVRLGNEEQAVMRRFRDLHNVVAYGSASNLPYNVAQTFDTQGDDVEAIEITITSPQLYVVAGGGFFAETIDLTFEYRRDGIGAWSTPDLWSMTGQSGSPVRQTFRWDDLTAGQYEIRIVKTSRDSEAAPEGADRWESNCFVASIDEIRYEPLSYPYTAMLGLKVQATDQMSGSLPKVTTVIEGLKVETFTGSGSTVEYSTNPMWCLWDLMVNTRYGAGNQISATRLDSTLALEGADYCDDLVSVAGASSEKRFELDVVLDTQRPALDMIRDVAQTFRGMPFWSEGTIKPLIDKVETPTQLFGMGNIKRGSFNEGFGSLNERPNHVEIQYANRDNDWERDSVAVLGDLTNGTRKQVMNLEGITRATQAQRIGEYVVRSGQNNTRIINFEAASDAVTSDAGDVINFAHDVPGWSVSGRVDASTNGTITLDQDVTLGALASGEAYYVDVRINADDSMEQKQIADGAGTYVAGTPINIVGVWATNPSRYDVYSLGLTGPKPFRIMEIGRRANDVVGVTAIEYSASVYSDASDDSPLNFSYLPDPRKPPKPVVNLSMTMEQTPVPAIRVMWAVDAWDSDFGLWDHAEVWVSEGPSNEPTLRGETGSTAWTINAVTPGTTYTAWIVSVSTNNVRSSVRELAPSAALTARRPTPPRKVSRLEVDHQGNTLTFATTDPKFTWDMSSVIFRAEPVGRETMGVGGTRDNSDTHDGYQVDISVSGVVVRTEHVSSSHYTYLFADNASDNAGSAARAFTVTVRERDIYGQTGPPESIDVNNENPPAPTNLSLEVKLGGGAGVKWDAIDVPDLIGYLVYNTFDGAPVDPALLLYQGTDTQYTFTSTDPYDAPPSPPGNLVVYQVAGYDGFGIPTALDGSGKPLGLNYAGVTNATV